MHSWGDLEWRGRARMALARQAAGSISAPGPHDSEGNPTVVQVAPLDALDREALRRYPHG